jgi:hypothetical protein
MTTAIPDTRQKSFEDWAAGVVLAYPGAELTNYWFMGWQDWGRQLFERADFDSILLPQPERYETWQQWGDALRQATDGLEA